MIGNLMTRHFLPELDLPRWRHSKSCQSTNHRRERSGLRRRHRVSGVINGRRQTGRLPSTIASSSGLEWASDRHAGAEVNVQNPVPPPVSSSERGVMVSMEGIPTSHCRGLKQLARRISCDVKVAVSPGSPRKFESYPRRSHRGRQTCRWSVPLKSMLFAVNRQRDGCISCCWHWRHKFCDDVGDRVMTVRIEIPSLCILADYMPCREQ